MSKTIGLILVFASVALSPCYADVAHCRFITEAKERLACFDKAAAPAQISKDPSAIDPSEKREPAEDILKRESDQLSKRMGAICRGC